MSHNIEVDFTDMETRLKRYVDKGRVAGASEVSEGPLFSIKPDVSLIKPLKKLGAFEGSFMAVDCSTKNSEACKQLGDLSHATSLCHNKKTSGRLGLQRASLHSGRRCSYS